MLITVAVKARTMMDALHLEALPSTALNFVDELDLLDLEVDVDVDVFMSKSGLIDPDDAPDEEEIADNVLAGMEPRVRDLEDSITALIAGDRPMASILMCRALDQWPDAARMVEDALRSPAQPDSRQLTFISAC